MGFSELQFSCASSVSIIVVQWLFILNVRERNKRTSLTLCILCIFEMYGSSNVPFISFLTSYLERVRKMDDGSESNSLSSCRPFKVIHYLQVF